MSNTNIKTAKINLFSFILITLFAINSLLIAQEYDSSLDAAYAYLNTGRTNEAIAIFEDYIKLNPEDMQINLQLAYSYKQIGDNKKALASFEYVSSKSLDAKEVGIANTEIKNITVGNIQLDNSETSGELETGYANIKEGNNIGAIIAFESYKLKHPDNSKIYLQLGYLYNEQKLYDKAIENFEFVESNSKNTSEIEKAAQSKYYLKESLIESSDASANIYFYNIYDSYYRNYIANFIGHMNFHLLKNTFMGLYIDANMDSRSRPGNIYNDRYFETGGFFKYMLNENIGFEMRTGFVREIDFAKNSFNFKPIVFAGTRIGSPAFFSRSENSRTLYPYFDVFSMGLYDYKFRNLFGQLQMKEVLRTMTGGYSYLEFYLNQSVFADSKKFDFNNYSEIGAGIGYKPSLIGFPVLFLEATNKFYFVGSGGQYFQGSRKNTFQIKAGILLNYNSKLW